MLAGIFLAVIVGALIIKWYSDTITYDATLYVYSVPDRLTVSYDNVKNQGLSSKTKHPVKSGEYTFTFKADGFSEYSTKLSIKKGEQKILVFALTPQTEAARRESAKDKYREVYDGVGSKKANQGAAKLEQSAPLVNKLPYYSRWWYVITCKPYRTADRTQRLGVCIVTSDKNSKEQVDQAMNYLKKNDTNLDRYDLKINGYPYPTSKEMRENTLMPCGGSQPSWCYIYPEEH